MRARDPASPTRNEAPVPVLPRRKHRTAVAIRQSGVDGMGTLRSLLESRGYRTRYRDALRGIDPLEVDLLVLLGGTLRASDALQWGEEIELIRVRCHYGLPTLGIGVGAQLLACALGGRVQALAQPEISLAPVQLTLAGRRSCLCPLGEDTTPVLHWHADEIVLPAHLKRLAATPACPTQAFSGGDKVLGLQFHLQAHMDHINACLLRDHFELADAGVDPVALAEQGSASVQRMRHACHAVMTRWLDQLDGAPADPDGTAPGRASKRASRVRPRTA